MAIFIEDNMIKNMEVADIDPGNTQLYKPIKDLHIGGRSLAMCVNQPLGEQELRFRQDCRVFLIQLCSQMKKIFPFQSDGVLAMLSALNSKEALSTDRSLTSIVQLPVHFPSLVHETDPDELEDQWTEILYAKATLSTKSTSPTELWAELRAVRDGNDARKFELLGNFMCNLLI